MATKNFSNISEGNFLFSGLTATETDVGSTSPFITTTAPIPTGLPGFGTIFPAGLDWSGYNAGAFGPGSSQTIDISFTLDDTNSANAITGLGSLSIIRDTVPEIGATGTAVETAYDQFHNVIGTVTWTAPDNAPATSSPAFMFGTGYQHITVDLVITLSVAPTAPSTSQIDISDVQQTFFEGAFTPPTPAIAIDKQISPDGGNTWFDITNGVLNGPTVLAGSTLQERVIVTNTGSVTLNNVHVSDLGAGPSGFNFGGNGTITLGVGASATSDLGAYVDTGVLVHQFDTATVTGTGSVGGTVSATDKADYTPVVPAIAIDKQISPDNGTTWLDQGHGNLADNPTVLQGTTVLERVIVTNTGSLPLTGVVVVDTGNGPASFNLGTSTLAVGQTVTSAAGSYVTTTLGQLNDTATVTGTGTDTWGHHQDVTDTDRANYNQVKPAVSLDKQISGDGGTTWLDVGIGVLNGPTVAPGTTLQERVIVTNTGPVPLTNLTVSDLGAGPASFAVGSSLAVGASETSAIGTWVATGTVRQFDTATVNGTGTDTWGHSAPVTANDTADYTPLQTPLAALGDYVFLDANGNGIQDAGDYGVAGVTVKLLAANSVLKTTTTDNTGHYSFTQLQPGSYQVQFVLPAGSGYSFTKQYQGSNIATDSNANPNTGIAGESSTQSTITLVAGQTDNTVDAGVIGSNPLSTPFLALAFLDSNGNNIQDKGEHGVAGVTVSILTGDGKITLGSAVTGNNGKVPGNAFNNLLLYPNDYEVGFIPPSGYAVEGESVTPKGGSTTFFSNTNGITDPVYVGANSQDTFRVALHH